MCGLIEWNVSFGGCLSKYRRTFIVYMFRRPPEVFDWVSDNALISGFGKAPMANILQTTFSNVFSWKQMSVFLFKLHWIFVPKSPIHSKTPLVKVMAQHWIGDKPLSEPIMAYFIDIYVSQSLDQSTHCGLMTANGDIDLGQHLVR